MGSQATVQVAFRFDPHLVERLDAYAQRMAREVPGVTFTRADAVRALLERGLAEAGLPGPEAKRSARGRRR